MQPFFFDGITGSLIELERGAYPSAEFNVWPELYFLDVKTPGMFISAFRNFPDHPGVSPLMFIQVWRALLNPETDTQ